MSKQEIEFNPVCSEKLIYFPFSFLGLAMAITIKPKDKKNLWVKFENPIRSRAGNLPKKNLQALINTLHKFIDK